MNKFLTSYRLEKDVDLAVLGWDKALKNIKNFVVGTNIPLQIIQFIEQSGTLLPKARQYFNKRMSAPEPRVGYAPARVNQLRFQNDINNSENFIL